MLPKCKVVGDVDLFLDVIFLPALSSVSQLGRFFLPFRLVARNFLISSCFQRLRRLVRALFLLLYLSAPTHTASIHDKRRGHAGVLQVLQARRHARRQTRRSVVEVPCSSLYSRYRKSVQHRRERVCRTSAIGPVVSVVCSDYKINQEKAYEGLDII